MAHEKFYVHILKCSFLALNMIFIFHVLTYSDLTEAKYAPKLENNVFMYKNKIINMEVVGDNGDKLGKIIDTFLSTNDESTLFVIISIKSTLDEDELLAIPIDNFTFKNKKAFLGATLQEIHDALHFYNTTP
ncbi:MAG: PRC-barrel domain-containing protein [Nitrosomonas sp.]|nr:PRC-barrel domain-containing protein [Nitrosomonas sp.]